MNIGTNIDLTTIVTESSGLSGAKQSAQTAAVLAARSLNFRSLICARVGIPDN
jgi:hypothetical protein